MTKQLLVMTGRLTKGELEVEYPEGIPKEFDPEQLPTISRHQVVFFDEVHMDQECGPCYRHKYQIRFPRDAQGRYAPQSTSNPNPIYAPLKPKPTFKYSQQARFCLGVAAVKKLDGSINGRRSLVFDYTSQRLVSIKEYRERTKAEIERVRNLDIQGRRSK